MGAMQTGGLGSFRTGSPRTRVEPTKGSKTQRRKAALATYSPEEKKNGRNVKRGA